MLDILIRQKHESDASQKMFRTKVPRFVSMQFLLIIFIEKLSLAAKVHPAVQAKTHFHFKWRKKQKKSFSEKNINFCLRGFQCREIAQPLSLGALLCFHVAWKLLRLQRRRRHRRRSPLPKTLKSRTSGSAQTEIPSFSFFSDFWVCVFFLFLREKGENIDKKKREELCFWLPFFSLWRHTFLRGLSLSHSHTHALSRTHTYSFWLSVLL